jgi:hypothetical protein
MCYPANGTKAKNNVSPAKKLRSLKRWISFQKKKMSQQKTHQLLVCPKKTPLSPPKKSGLSISIISSTSYFPNVHQPAPEPPQQHTDPPQPAADLSQAVEDDDPQPVPVEHQKVDDKILAKPLSDLPKSEPTNTEPPYPEPPNPEPPDDEDVLTKEDFQKKMEKNP